MSAWLPAAPSVVAAIALVTLPGLPAAWLLRFRGLGLVAVSVAASVAAVALASVAAPMLGLTWGIQSVVAAASVLAIATLPVRLLTKSVQRVPKPATLASLWTAASLFVAGILIATIVCQAIGSPSNISQTYDGVFHVNAAAKILLSGDASPFHMDLAAPGSANSFYPTVWHGFVALITQLTGASVPIATNAFALTVAAWIWPVSILFFSRPFFVRRPAHMMLGAILAASFTAFPFLLLAWGVLYPNLLSTALIPIALGLLYPAMRSYAMFTPAPRFSLCVAAIGAIGAVTLSHPNGLFGIAALTAPLLIAVANDVRRLPLSPFSRSVRWAAIALVLLFFAGMWLFVRTGDNSRTFDNNIIRAFLDGFSNAPMLDTRAWFLTVFVTAGAAVLFFQRRHRWLVLSYIAVLLLFVISSGLDGGVRDAFTGAWYNDPHRLAALLPIAAIPLAAIASSHLFDFVARGVRNVEASQGATAVKRFLPCVGALLVFAMILTGGRSQNFARQSGWIADLYQPSGLLLSEDERALLERLPEEVPENAVIAGDPWTGTGLALAISHREVLFGHLKGSYSSETLELASSFNEFGVDACPLLNRLGVTYILDFGDERYSIGQDSLYAPYVGLTDVGSSAITTEVDREGEAALFRVDCE